MEKDSKNSLYPQDFLIKYLVLPFIPQAVKPNHLTILRFILSPIVIWLMLEEKYLTGMIVFLIAAFTDALDGSLARLRNQITKWGGTYDPLADKILIGSVFLIVGFKYFFYTTITIILIELSFIIGGWWYRLKNIELKVNLWGKIKMNLQVLSLIILLTAAIFNIGGLFYISLILMDLAIIFGLISLFNKGV